MRSDMSPLSSRRIEATSSSGYDRSKGQNSNFQTRPLTDVTLTDIPSTNQSRRTSQVSRGGRETIKLIPMKYEDLMQVLKLNPQYKDKTPLMINMREIEIDQILQKQHYHNDNSANSIQLQSSVRQSIQLSPITINQPVERDYHFERRSFETEYTSPNEQTSRSDRNPISTQSINPPLGQNQPQVYAMTNIQAYPMIGADNSFKANKRRKVTPRKKSRKKIGSKFRKSKSRSKSQGFRADKSRGRSRRRLSPRRKKSFRVRSSKRKPRARSTVIVRRKRRPVSGRSRGRRGISPSHANDRAYCTPYPLCEYDCTPFTHAGRLQSPYRTSSRPLFSQNSAGIACNCTLCQEKLQFIQPGVCTQKKDTWTNEYAIIPKPQVNLIDPCTELDPSIYPRADRPCIRDGRGNPLTDCIGRPLRDPVGKRFLNFSANGSVMDTNYRGNFFTGQPPVCVKCPLPSCSCAPDTTHNWWMSCGYPVKANMAPFFNNVVARENALRRH